MKQLPRATAKKTKPICKNEKMNLNPCTKMTYEEKCPLRRPEKQTQSNPIFSWCLGFYHFVLARLGEGANEATIKTETPRRS
jgi:hypothetical protein